MEFKDYLDKTKLKIESKKGLDVPIVRFGVKYYSDFQAVDLDYFEVRNVINELNKIVENEN